MWKSEIASYVGLPFPLSSRDFQGRFVTPRKAMTVEPSTRPSKRRRKMLQREVSIETQGIRQGGEDLVTVSALPRRRTRLSADRSGKLITLLKSEMEV